MPHITYVEADGRSTTVAVQEGWSLLQGAFSAGAQGIVGECGGACTCGTCHCYVEEARLADLPQPLANELEMLEFVAAERRPTSRLACQIQATPAIDGLVLQLPDLQQ
jgi:2Fe-2S ferredoxin